MSFVRRAYAGNCFLLSHTGYRDCSSTDRLAFELRWSQNLFKSTL